MTIEKARQLLGKRAKNLSDEEVNNLNVFIRELVCMGLDDYERKAFGKTLKEMEDLTVDRL